MGPAKPFSQACENNKDPILGVLRESFVTARLVLEIGSGTGQHAVYFAAHLPHVIWQTSDLSENHPGILAWLEDAALSNLRPPLSVDVSQDEWGVDAVDGVFSANTAHIMSCPQVAAMFAGVGRVLKSGGIFCLYGPFNYQGRYTSDSNARFDQWLKARDPRSGIRDIEALTTLAEQHELTLTADHAMPANNRTLVWQKTSRI